MLYRLVLLITALGLTVPCASRADTIARYWQWQNLDQKTKALYAAGLLDGGNVMLILSGASGDAKYHINVVALANCIQYNRLSGSLLVDMIDDAYFKDPKQWNNSPSDVLKEEISNLCRSWLEQASNPH